MASSASLGPTYIYKNFKLKLPNLPFFHEKRGGKFADVDAKMYFCHALTPSPDRKQAGWRSGTVNEY
jgi:hypothetical protein